MRAYLLPILAAFALTACERRPPEFGVTVFSGDTVTATFSMTVTGTLVMGLRAEDYRMRPDSNLEMTTPAEIIIQSGEGSALIEVVGGGRLAVKPLGIHPDSGDTAAVEGVAVRVTRPADRRLVRLAVERP